MALQSACAGERESRGQCASLCVTLYGYVSTQPHYPSTPGCPAPFLTTRASEWRVITESQPIKRGLLSPTQHQTEHGGGGLFMHPETRQADSDLSVSRIGALMEGTQRQAGESDDSHPAGKISDLISPSM